jgi:hypothetical protein
MAVFVPMFFIVFETFLSNVFLTFYYYELNVYSVNDVKQADKIVVGSHTEREVLSRRLQLQNEAANLTSYLRQHRDVTGTSLVPSQR